MLRSPQGYLCTAQDGQLLGKYVQRCCLVHGSLQQQVGGASERCLPVCTCSPLQETWIGHGLHHDLRVFQRLHASQLADAGITYDDLVHAMGLLGTRSFSQPAPGGGVTVYAVPLLDMANHDNACPHRVVFGQCSVAGAGPLESGGSTEECAMLLSGTDIPAGSEVCLFYGHLLMDRALLEYGFLPGQQQQQPSCSGNAEAACPQAPPPELFGIDRHDADENEPLVKLHEAPAPFSGAMRRQCQHEGVCTSGLGVSNP